MGCRHFPSFSPPLHPPPSPPRCRNDKSGLDVMLEGTGGRGEGEEEEEVREKRRKRGEKQLI